MPRNFLAEWERCAAWLQAALDHGGQTHTLGDAKWLVLNEPETFWFWPGERSAAITEIVRYPRLHALRVWLAGGDMDEILSAAPDVEARGVLAGCTRFELIGRPGWKRILRGRGYAHRADVCWKELTP